MTTLTTKSWFEDGKLISVTIPEANIYKREWVGLTVEDHNNLWRAGLSHQDIDLVEAKLKEKNT